MPRRHVKEEERTETIIRGLLKQPENRRCINCNSLGPQYVCTTFWTFVCTICSGVHREFTHRVKSVSMAKFSEEEITALQAGGNERAREIYFKAWDPQRNSYPDGSNLHRLREFVKHVYIDRNYAGQNYKHLSIIINKLDSMNNYSERSSSSRDDLKERSSFEQSSPFKRNGGIITFKDILEERSPRNSYSSHELGKSSTSRSHRPAARFEIVDDRFRDDGSVKRYDHRYSKRESGGGGSRSPVSHQICAPTTTNLPLVRVRPFKEILGEKVPALKIGGPPKFNEKKDAEGSARCQNAADTATQVPTGANQTVNPNSLINFDPKPEPTNNPLEPQAITTSQDNNESIISVASSTTQTAPNAPNTDSLESLLFDLSGPVSSPSTGASQISTPDQSNGSKATDGALSVEIVPNDQPLHDNSKYLTEQVARVHELPSMQQNEHFHAPPGNSSSNARQELNNSNDLMLVQNVPLEQSSQAPDQGDGSKATARKEIPQDLFTSSNFASFTPAVAGWQMHPPYGTGYGKQFGPPAMSATGFPNPSRPKNPFDIGDDRFQADQAAVFPSMSSLQGALPNMPPSTALVSHASSPYARQLPPHISTTYGMNMTQVPGAYMGQLPNNMPLTRPQENGNLTKSEDAFASLNPIQLTSGTNSSSSRTGNPFG